MSYLFFLFHFAFLDKCFICYTSIISFQRWFWFQNCMNFELKLPCLDEQFHLQTNFPHQGISNSWETWSVILSGAHYFQILLWISSRFVTQCKLFSELVNQKISFKNHTEFSLLNIHFKNWSHDQFILISQSIWGNLLQESPCSSSYPSSKDHQLDTVYQCGRDIYNNNISSLQAEWQWSLCWGISLPVLSTPQKSLNLLSAFSYTMHARVF